MRVEKIDFPTTQYVREISTKRQIVLHHTASGPGVDGDVSWWKKTLERVATHYIIDRNGVIYQLFDEKYYAYHLGVSKRDFEQVRVPYQQLDRSSIGIELDNWGYLAQHSDGQFYPAKWDTVKKRNVANLLCKPVRYIYEYCQKYKWRGNMYYERYTTLQLTALRDLLQDLCSRHHIPIKYNEDMWQHSAKAMSGVPGIWAHCSFRKDKSDVHPQPELIDILKSL